MSDQNDKQKDFLINFHKALTTDLHEAQRNFISLIAAVIGSMGIFGFGLKSFLDTPCIQNAIYFTIATAGAVILQLIVIFSANVAGYSFRSSQIILSMIEGNFSITEKILPRNWNLCERDSKDCVSWIEPPEIFLFFKRFAYFVIAGIVIAYILIMVERFFYKETLEMLILIIIVIILYFVGLIWAMLLRFRWSFCKDSYATKLKKICSDIEKAKEDAKKEGHKDECPAK